MDYPDPDFERWLDDNEAEASRVKRMGDWRERQASELLLYINQARILGSRNDGTHASQIETLLKKITDLRARISK